MVNDIAAGTTPSLYSKVGVVPGLYRHTISGRYYGAKKVHGKRKERSLGTTDRRIAERRLREWVRNLQVVRQEMERTTLRELVERFVAVNQGKSAKTRATNSSIIHRVETTFPGGMEAEVRQIRPSQLDEWLALHEKRLKNTSYNRYAGFLNALFDVAVRDGVIAESPFVRVRTKRKKPQPPVRLLPNTDQFRSIIESIRSQHPTDRSAQSGDFIEFLGLAGLGQAEASSITWGDIDWKMERISVRRHKTDARFHVPIYPELKPLLRRLRAKAGDVPLSVRIFAIKDAKKALKGACERLRFPNFSQRSLRRVLIQRLWRAGVDKKLIAKWQGHQDGGQLIMDTYTEVFGDDEADYERQQLKKLSP